MSEISSDMRLRSEAPALPAELVEARWYLKTTGRAWGSPCPSAAGGTAVFRFHELHTFRRPVRRKVTESIIFSIRWTPIPPSRSAR